MDVEDNESSQRLTLTLAVVILLLLILDCFVGPVFDEGPSATLGGLRIGLVLGACVGQLNLISIWAAISRGPVVVRLPCAYLLLFFVWAAIGCGRRVDSSYSVQDAFDLGIVLLLCCTAAQIPLWIASRVMGWQLCRESQSAATTNFQLSHMFVGMMLLAMMLAIARVLLAGAEEDLSMSLPYEIQFVVMTLTIANLIVVVPFVWGSFYCSHVATFLAAVCVSLVAAAVVVLIFSSIIGPGFKPSVLVVLIGFNFGQIAVVHVVLRILRRLGFRLARTKIGASGTPTS